MIEPEAQFIASPFEDVAGSFSRFATNQVTADFDGDAIADVAIGEPWQSAVAGVSAAGAVHLYRGGSSMLTLAASLTAANIDVLQPLQANALFGAVLAPGDFNGDGCIDLAAGLPSLDVDAIDRAGGVVVLGNGTIDLFHDGFEGDG